MSGEQVSGSTAPGRAWLRWAAPGCAWMRMARLAAPSYAWLRLTTTLKLIADGCTERGKRTCR